jgi:hypothetical protein
VELVNQYMETVKDGSIPSDLDVNQVLDIYENFLMVSRSTSWTPVLASCTCQHSSKHCICLHSVLFGMLFDSSLQCPDEYIAATPSARKKTRLPKGTAGPKRMCLMMESRKEKHKSVNRTAYLEPTRKAAADLSSVSEVRSCLPRYCIRVGVSYHALAVG